MNRRRLVINGVIVLALVGVGAGTYVSLAATKPVPLTPGQVVTVSRGTVVATVTASGNAKARSTVAQSLNGASGTVTQIYVHSGQRVTKGQRLLKVDDGDARDDVENAESDLRSAQAQLQTATQGRTLAEQQQDQASIASAETSLKNAKTSVHAAQQTQDLDSKQQDKLVHEAEKALHEAKHPSTPSGGTTSGTGGSGGSTSQSTEQQAQSSLLQAKQSRDATELKDKQAITSAKGQVDSAQRTLNSQRATVAVNDQPADADTVASAQTAVDKDEVALKQAKATLADTTLKASVAGTVGTISAVKGQSSSGAGSSSSSSGTSSSTSSGSSTSGGTGTSTTSSSSASSTGLVEIVDTTHLQVTADVAEADIVKVRNGQSAAAVFAASNKTVQGRVSAIDTTSTVTNNVVEYGVTITLDASASSLRVGQTATITITTGTRQDALSVPTSALTRTGDRYTVLRRANGADSTVEVQTGLVGTTDTEITSGLNEGDQVVIALTTATTSTGGGPPRRGG